MRKSTPPTPNWASKMKRWYGSIRARRIITRAQVSDRPNKGAVYMTYQWWIGACNELVSENLSPITKTPEYCAVNVERIADAPRNST